MCCMGGASSAGSSEGLALFEDQGSLLPCGPREVHSRFGLGGRPLRERTQWPVASDWLTQHKGLRQAC